MTEEEIRKTSSYKFKLTLQRFLRHDSIAIGSAISLFVIGMMLVFLGIGFIFNYTIGRDSNQRNLYYVGNNDYKESFIIYNTNEVHECIKRNEDGDKLGELMYVKYTNDNESLDSNFFWSTVISKYSLGLLCVFFCFQLLALGPLNYYINSYGDRYEVEGYNYTEFYNYITLTIISIMIIVNISIVYCGNIWKDRTDKVYTEAIMAIDFPIKKDPEYIVTLSTSNKFRIVNTYLKKHVYHKNPLMYDIKNKKYEFFDYDKIKNTTIIEKEMDKYFEEKK